MSDKPVPALMYDFDHTLLPKDRQETLRLRSTKKSH